MVNYTTTTTNTEAYKTLITGRADDVTILVDDITQGNSVVLFGERRIGKTSILYLIRDIINNNIDNYRNKLIDLSLKNIIDSLKTRVLTYQVIYVDIAPLQNEGETFEELLYANIEGKNLIQNFSRKSSLVATFRTSNSQLEQNQKRLLILVDESERLCNLPKQDNILSNIKSITQTCPQIQFILAGAEPWYSNFKRDDNPLRNIKFHYLKSASPSAIREDLIRKPFLNYLNPNLTSAPNQTIIDKVEEIANYTAECTGYKPSYVQSVCFEIKKFLQNNSNELTQNWKYSVLEKVKQQEEDKTLRYFYTASYVDKISQDILALLAHQTELNFEQIAIRLPHSENKIRDKLSDLESLDKIYQNQVRQYRLVGTLVENWGQENIPLPSINNLWVQRLKWIGAIVSVSLAVWVYSFTHPSLKTVICQFPTEQSEFPKSQILIHIPSSLEVDERGKATFLISNLDQKKIDSLAITVSSPDNEIEYHKDNTNLIAVKALNLRETEYHVLDFIVRSNGTENNLSSEISIVADLEKQSLETCNFNIYLRPLPVKKYWGIVSIVFTAIGGFLVKKDLPQLLNALYKII